MIIRGKCHNEYNSSDMNGSKTIWKRVLIVLLLAIVGLSMGAFSFAWRILRQAKGEHSGGGPISIVQTFQDIGQIVGNPYAGFPNQSKIVILCMGIDDNWTNSDEVYTRAARTDTLF